MTLLSHRGNYHPNSHMLFNTAGRYLPQNLLNKHLPPTDAQVTCKVPGIQKGPALKEFTVKGEETHKLQQGLSISMGYCGNKILIIYS